MTEMDPIFTNNIHLTPKEVAILRPKMKILQIFEEEVDGSILFPVRPAEKKKIREVINKLLRNKPLDPDKDHELIEYLDIYNIPTKGVQFRPSEAVYLQGLSPRFARMPLNPNGSLNVPLLNMVQGTNLAGNPVSIPKSNIKAFLTNLKRNASRNNKKRLLAKATGHPPINRARYQQLATLYEVPQYPSKEDARNALEAYMATHKRYGSQDRTAKKTKESLSVRAARNVINRGQFHLQNTGDLPVHGLRLRKTHRNRK